VVQLDFLLRALRFKARALGGKIKTLGRQSANYINRRLLSLQATCHLFAAFHLPSGPELPSIQIESRPAGLVMAVTDF
jgi:hypothetical protein